MAGRRLMSRCWQEGGRAVPKGASPAFGGALCACPQYLHASEKNVKCNELVEGTPAEGKSI